MMRVNIYYGGRGLIEDPTIYVMQKITQVLEELNIQVKRYNLYEDTRGISVLPKTLKEADGVIIAASVEWLGIGGLLQHFLDSCWLYGDKDKIHSLYMMPVVTSTVAGEKDAYQMLQKAWEILGGIPIDGICAYVANYTDFETDPDYGVMIEKRTETYYRSFTKKLKAFPTSTNAVCANTLKPKTMHLTPQESEQLSMYVSDDKYVQKQKEDIEELTTMFRGLLGDDSQDPAQGDHSLTPDDDFYVEALTNHFCPIPDCHIAFEFQFQDSGKTMLVKVQGDTLHCSSTTDPNAAVQIKLNQKIMERIIRGDITLHNAFLSGSLIAKGDFKQLPLFDTLFPFADA